MIKGIIFDYGGTLDTGGRHWSEVIREGWEKAGVVADNALFWEAYVYAEKELERVRHILPEHDFQDVMNIKLQIELGYLAQNGHFPPAQVASKAEEIASYCHGVAEENIKKAQPVLASLSQKYPMVVVSNFYGNLKTVLKSFGLLEYFKDVIDSTEVGKRKPDKSIFELGVKRLGFNPEEIMVVGDSEENDIKPAQALGCQTLLLRNVDKAGEDVLNQGEISSLKSLEEILSDWL